VNEKRLALLAAQVFLIGVIVLDFFAKQETINYVASNIRMWAVVIAAFTLTLGAASLGSFHVGHIRRRTRGEWPFSLWTLLCIVMTFFFGMTASAIPQSDAAYKYLTNTVLNLISTATFGITGFYMFSLAYRSFVGRSIDVALFLLSGIFVILMNAPSGEVIWSGFPIVATWILDVPSMAGTRGFVMGVGLGTLATVLRALLGKEKGGVGGGFGG